MMLSPRTIAAGLAARHPDRAQHPELAGALVHGEDQRVDHAEQAHDHRQSPSST